MQNIAFEKRAFQEFTEWASIDKKIHSKIVELINDILRTPFIGLGKPEPLKHELQGYWSRRITNEHRLVYKVTDEQWFGHFFGKRLKPLIFCSSIR